MSEDCNPFSHILWPQGSQPKLVETAQATSMGFSCAGCPRPVKQMHYVFGGNRVCSFLSLLQSHSRVSTQRMASGFLVPLSLVDYPDFLYTLYAAMAAIVLIDEENTVCLFFGSHFATPILFSYQPQLYDSVRRPLDVIYPASRMTQYWSDQDTCRWLRYEEYQCRQFPLFAHPWHGADRFTEHSSSLSWLMVVCVPWLSSSLFQHFSLLSSLLPYFLVAMITHTLALCAFFPFFSNRGNAEGTNCSKLLCLMFVYLLLYVGLCQDWFCSLGIICWFNDLRAE